MAKSNKPKPDKKGNPLKMLNEAWKDLSKTQKEKLIAIEEEDFSFLIGEQIFRQGVINKRHHIEAVEELKKFLAIKILKEPHPLGMFSPIVAAAWHAFILDTIKYESFCKKHYGKTIHHIPGGGAHIDNSIWMSMYREWFGLFPPVWKLDIGGTEIPGYEHSMNVEGNLDSGDLDSDDGAHP